jgi:uncharacterized membrane protein YgcG
MRSFRRIAVVTVSAVLLVAGVVLGFMPVKTQLTEIQPELRLLNVSCGNNFLRASLPALPGNLVALPEEPGVYLPRADYDAHCGAAAGWKRYVAWGLTALGALGLALTFSAARTPSGPGSPRPSGPGRSDGPGGSGGPGRPGGPGGSGGRGRSGGGPAEPAASSAEPSAPSEEAGSRHSRHRRRNETAS